MAVVAASATRATKVNLGVRPSAYIQLGCLIPPLALATLFSGVRFVDAAKPGPLTPDKVSEALADTYSRRVLAVCVRHAKPVKDIATEAGLALPTTYRHVNRLEEAGLIVVERSALTPDGKKYDLYRSRLRAARIEIDGSGERVTWELNEAVEDRLASMWDSLRGVRRL